MQRLHAATLLGLAGLAAGDSYRSSQGHRVSEITQLALATAEGLIRTIVRFRCNNKQPHVQEQIRRAYLRWASLQGLAEDSEVQPLGWLSRQRIMREHRLQGDTNRSALKGARIQPLAATNNSKGSACVPRAAPCGFVHAEPIQLFHFGAKSAAITHGHPVAHAAAGVFALTLHFLGHTERFVDLKHIQLSPLLPSSDSSQ